MFPHMNKIMISQQITSRSKHTGYVKLQVMVESNLTKLLLNMETKHVPLLTSNVARCR